jgi:hypothetical protein
MMMDTSRRELLAAGTVLTALLASGASAAPDPAPPGLMEVLHVHAGPDGPSRARKVRIFGTPKPLPAKELQIGAIGAGSATKWGTTPSKRFSINVSGEIDAELGDGTRHRIRPGDLVYLEDLSGTGHLTHFLTPVANIYIFMPDDFDFQAWAGHPPGA